MSKSGLADSPFFTTPIRVAVKAPSSASLPKAKKVEPHSPTLAKEKPQNKKAPEVPEKKQATPLPVSQPESGVSRSQDEILDLVQKACHELGKEASTHRFTVAEKRHISEIIYTYKTQGIKTTENEITRIAVNYLLEDYKANGENSLLDRLLKALYP